MDFLAQSPNGFAYSGSHEPMTGPDTGSSYSISHRGLEIKAGMISHLWWYYSFVVLDCFDAQRCNRRLALKVYDRNMQEHLKLWAPESFTEYALEYASNDSICSVDMALSEKLNVVRSFTIFNRTSDSSCCSLDFRLRCIVDGALDQIACVADAPESPEEVSFNVLSCCPQDSWDHAVPY